jgi:hypothetical protein
LTQFRLLASFLIFQTLNNVVRFLALHYSSFSSWTYYSVYWVGTAMSDMFAIAVLYEVFCAAFKPFAGLQDLAKLVFKWAAVSIIMIGFAVFALNPSNMTARYSWIAIGVNDFERIVCIMECALLMFLYLGSDHLGFSKRNRVFGFALGFGTQSFFQLIIYSFLANAHPSKIPFYTHLLPVVSFFSLLIWTAYLIQPEPARESLHIPVTSPLLRWNEVALALGHSGGHVALMNSEPFMPTVERMVEQVMQKEMIIDRRQPRAV